MTWVRSPGRPRRPEYNQPAMLNANAVPGAHMLGTLPIFPLPNVVLLPGMVLPLNVFEPRYLDLVDFVRAHDQHIGVPLLRPSPPPGAEAAPPPFEPIFGVGKLVFHVRLPDGRRIIRLEGIGRVQLQREQPTGRGFRELAVLPLGEPQPADMDQIQALRDHVGRLASHCGDDSESLLSLLGLRDARVFLYSLTAFLPSLELLSCDLRTWVHDDRLLVSLQQRSLAAEDADARARFLLERTRTILDRLGQHDRRAGALLN